MRLNVQGAAKFGKFGMHYVRPCIVNLSTIIPTFLLQCQVSCCYQHCMYYVQANYKLSNSSLLCADTSKRTLLKLPAPQNLSYLCHW